jgi:hypothetical protein
MTDFIVVKGAREHPVTKILKLRSLIATGCRPAGDTSLSLPAGSQGFGAGQETSKKL